MDWTLPLTVAGVAAVSVGSILIQRWSLKRAVRRKAERDAESSSGDE